MTNYTGNKINTLDTVATQLESILIVNDETYAIGTLLEGIKITNSDSYGYAGGWFETDDDDGSFPGPAGIWQVI